MLRREHAGQIHYWMCDGPLDKEGKQQCLQLAYVLNALKITFDVVISSPLKRSVQTAQLVATETGYEARILLSNALAPEATVAEFEQLLQQMGGREDVLMVGHNPNLQQFVGSLAAGARGGCCSGDSPEEEFAGQSLTEPGPRGAAAADGSADGTGLVPHLCKARQGWPSRAGRPLCRRKT